MRRVLLVLGLAAIAVAAGIIVSASPWDEPPVAPAQAVIAGEVAGAITFELQPRNDSGEFGFVTLQPAEDDRTLVLVDVVGAPSQPQPAHVHDGVCGAASPRPLEDVGPVLRSGNSGSSTVSTVLDTSVDALRRGHRVLDVHRSVRDPTVVACVQIGDAAD